MSVHETVKEGGPHIETPSIINQQHVIRAHRPTVKLMATGRICKLGLWRLFSYDSRTKGGHAVMNENVEPIEF